MKILIINLRIGTGSVGRIVSDIYHGALNAGFECKLAYGRGDVGDIPVEDTYKICTTNEIMIHAGLTRVFGNTAFYFSGSTERFCKWIDTYKPDIVHIHGVYGYYLNIETLFNYLAEKKIPVISTLHSCWDFTGHCCYFDYVKCDKWKTGCVKCRQKSAYPKSSWLDDTGKNYRRKRDLYNKLEDCTIVTPSEWLANLVKESFLSSKEIKVINNGIDTNSFKYRDETPGYIDIRKPTVLCVANIWERRKGWEDVIELSNQIDDSISLVVVGVSEKQKKELNPKTIVITRTNSKDELAMLYSHSTVFFNPTYEDNYPTVNLEAAACGVPIVTYNTGGSPEILKYGNWGIVIEYRDYQSLLSYTQKVFAREIQPDYSNAQILSNSNMVEQYLALYREKSLKN